MVLVSYQPQRHREHCVGLFLPGQQDSLECDTPNAALVRVLRLRSKADGFSQSKEIHCCGFRSIHTPDGNI
jgi:hypothetical protein